MTQDQQPWYGPYREAFLQDLNIAGLSIFFLVSLITFRWESAAFGVLAEAVYLLVAPKLSFFKEKSKARALRADREQFEKERMERMQQFQWENLDKAKELDKIRLEIFRVNNESLEAGEGHGILRQEDLEKVNALFLSYLHLLFLKVQYEEHIKQGRSDEIEQEMNKLSGELSQNQQPEVREMIEKNIEILKKRLDHVSQISTLSRRLEMQLREIENSFKLVADQVIEMKTGESASQNLSTLMTDVEATEQVAKEVSPILNQLQKL